MTTERTLAHAPKQASQRFISEKIKTLLRDFKFDVARQRLAHRPRSTIHLLAGGLRLRLFAQSEITLFNQPFD